MADSVMISALLPFLTREGRMSILDVIVRDIMESNLELATSLTGEGIVKPDEHGYTFNVDDLSRFVNAKFPELVLSSSVAIWLNSDE